jgi:hypothetical protein
LRNAYEKLARKFGRERPLGRIGSRWEADIKMDVGETGLKMCI